MWPIGIKRRGLILNEFLKAAAEVVGVDNLLLGPDTVGFDVDWRGRYQGKALCVARPGSTQEVSELMALCMRHGVEVLPQGGNTGLCGAATPSADGNQMVLWLGRMNNVRAFSEIDGSITLDAGCVLETVQNLAAEQGYFFPMSLGAEGSCQIGGNIATNAGGTAVLRYGPMRDLVLGLEVVLPDGTVHDWLTPLRKNNTGYDLKQLFMGAEGTLGIITAATLKVFPAPKVRELAMVTLHNVEQALTLLHRVRRSLGERLLSCEIINWAQVALVLKHAQGVTWPFAEPSPWCLLIEVTETLEGYDLRGALEAELEKALETELITDAVVATSQAQQNSLWQLRHSVSEANKLEGYGVTHDTAVPLSQQGVFATEVEQRLMQAYPQGQVLMVGHIGDGNIHVIHMFQRDQHSAEQLAVAAKGVHQLVDDVTLSLGGTVSAEHGIGQTNKARLQASRSPQDLALMKAIKGVIDPDRRMNPGKVFD